MLTFFALILHEKLHDIFFISRTLFCHSDGMWLEADDMNERFCIFDKKSLTFQASEVHLILFMAQPSDPANTPTFPLTFETPTPSKWRRPSYIRMKPNLPPSLHPSASASTSREDVSKEKKKEKSSNDERVIDDRPQGSRGVSFASIASEHVPKRKSKPGRPKCSDHHPWH